PATPEGLNAFGDFVDELVLLLRMLIQQQMELIEGRASHQPVMLLVQRVEDLRIGQDLIEPLTRIQPGVVARPQGKPPHRAERLNLFPVLVQPPLASLKLSLVTRLSHCSRDRDLSSRESPA